MLVFRMLCRITQSSKAHRTESVSVIDHEQTMGQSDAGTSCTIPSILAIELKNQGQLCPLST